MIKFFSYLISVLLILNFLLHFGLEKQEKKIQKLNQEYQNILKEMQLIKINFAFLTRPENLKDINKKLFYLEPYDLSNVKIMVLDSFERDYYINLGSSVVVEDKRKVSDIDVLLNGYSYLPHNQMFGSYAQGGQFDLGYMDFGLYTGQNGNGDYSANVGKTFWISDKLNFKTSIGQMNEQDTWLGNSSNGILAVGDNNTTNYGQFGASYQIGNNVLSLDYSKGYSDINTTNGSLIKGFSDVQTESYRLAYEIHKDKHNTLGW